MYRSIDVLIVDRIPSDAKRTSEAVRLARPAASTVVAFDAERAQRLMFYSGLFTETPQLPQLVFIDICVPGAKNLLLQVTRDPRTRDVPAIVLTESRNPSDIVESYLAGARIYISKPNDLDEYNGEIKRIADAWLRP